MYIRSTHNLDSTGHVISILHDGRSCNIETTYQPILAVTDRTKWKISRNGPPKRTLLEMGAVTGNGIVQYCAISRTGKLRVWVQ
jgi:hypothetical protein